MHVLGEQRKDRSLTLTLEAPAGTTQFLNIRRNVKAGTVLNLRAEGGELRGDLLTVHAPIGEGYQVFQTSIQW